MPAIKLVAIDLDGTLLDSRQRISPRNLTAIERLLARGVWIALATARDRSSIALKVPLIAPGLYYIGCGGAMVFDTAANEFIWAEYLPPALLAEAVSFLQAYDHPVFLNYDDQYWVDRHEPRVELIESRYNVRTQLFRDLHDIPPPILRASLAAPVHTLELAARDAVQRFGDRASVSLASPDWLDLLSSRAGKGRALHALQQWFDVGPAKTLAIGDYDSDLPLFEQADHRVAMGNAVTTIRAAATYITTTNDEDGVAQALDLFFSTDGARIRGRS